MEPIETSVSPVHCLLVLERRPGLRSTSTIDQQIKERPGMDLPTATVADTPLPKPEGLEGVVAASTALSHVFGEEGRLVYRGYDIHELAGKASFEEVAHLLWIGHLPGRAELDELQAKMETNRALPGEVIEVLRQMPADTAPMDALRTGLSALGAVDPDHFGGLPDLAEAI